jgi:hypothetical protein
MQLDFHRFPASNEVSSITKDINWPMIIDNHSYTSDSCRASESMALFLPRNSICASGQNFSISIIESRCSHEDNDKPSIESVIVSNSVTRLSYNCFAVADICLVVFEANSRLKIMDRCSFSGCLKLRSICIPRLIEVISAECFFKCKSLASLVFERNCKVGQIGARAFSGCKSLEWICIPRSVELLHPDCFSFSEASADLVCSDRHEMVLSESASVLRRIEAGGFASCSILKEICIP